MQARAVAIADEMMIAEIDCSLVPLEVDGTYGLVNGVGVEVSAIEDVSPGVRQAFEWLRDRGIARLDQDAIGTFIVLELE